MFSNPGGVSGSVYSIACLPDPGHSDCSSQLIIEWPFIETKIMSTKYCSSWRNFVFKHNDGTEDKFVWIQPVAGDHSVRCQM